jgi:TIR domain
MGDLAAQDRVGPFEVEELAGRGVTGDVYVARDTRTGRQVALKRLAPEAVVADAAAMAALRSVASDCQALVCVEAVEEWEGCRCLVMPHVPGTPLADLDDIPLERLLTILDAAATALDTLHGAGLAHGRLSAANLRLAPEGSEPIVYVTGLGVVLGRSASPDPAGDRAAFLHLATTALGLDAMRVPPLDTCAAIVSELTDAVAVAHAVGEDVQFTVFRPRVLEPERWTSLLAFAHLASGAQPPGEPDPLEEVERQVEAALGPAAPSYQQVTQDSRASVLRSSELTFRLSLPGMEVNPAERSFRWIEDVHREEFRVHATAALEGTTVRGELSVWLGPMILAEVPLALRVRSGAGQEPTAPVATRPYRHVFPSYSHDDAEIVEHAEAVAAALGDRYLRDVTTLRSGEEWGPRIEQLIEEADVFQLFWSTNAMRSEYVRREWEYALALERKGFIRPTYWEDPLPQDNELPPQALLDLHFARLPLSTIGAAAAPLPTSPPRPRRHRLRKLTLLVGAVAGLAAAAVVGVVSHTGSGKKSGASARILATTLYAAAAPDEALPKAYVSSSGTSIYYPKKWVARRGRERVGTIEVERLDVAEGPGRFAKARVHLLFGARGGRKLEPLLGAAKQSLRDHTRGAALVFDHPRKEALDLGPAVVQELAWRVSPSIGGRGFVFASHSRAPRRWVSGWGLYDFHTAAPTAGSRRNDVLGVLYSIS